MKKNTRKKPGKMKKGNQPKVLDGNGAGEKQIENIQDGTAEEKEKAQRRTTRIGIIIASVAVVGALGEKLLNVVMKILNVWPENGIAYWHMQILAASALAMGLILVYDMLAFIISDLQRYDTSKLDYKRYDQKSDKRYSNLFNDFRLYIIIFALVVSMSVPLDAIFGDGIQKWYGIIIFCIYVIAAIIMLAFWIKNNNKVKRKKDFRNIVGKSVKLIGVTVYCWLISLMIVASNKATISVNYNNNGLVTILNKSSESYNKMEVEICDTNGEVIYTENVKKSDLLFAREEKYINDEINEKNIAEGKVVDDECIYWKYTFDVDKVISEGGKYYIIIVVYQDSKRVLLQNEFTVAGQQYTFTLGEMKKEY